MVQLETLGDGGGLKPVQPGLRLVGQNVARPARRSGGVVVELLDVDRAGHDEVVVAGEAEVAHRLDERATVVRPGAVADRVAEAPDRVGAVALELGQDGLERTGVPVHVRDDGDAQVLVSARVLPAGRARPAGTPISSTRPASRP